jgi:hypothetical protein
MLERTKRGAPVDSANWDMANQLAALNARKDNMMAYTDDLLNGALVAYKALWPGQVPPNDPASLGPNLELSSIRLGEWRDSSAHIRADEALTYFLSWNEKDDLNILHSVCEGLRWTSDLALIRQRQELAHSYVDYAQTDEFMRDIHQLEKDASAADAKGYDSSQEEEETEDGGDGQS